MGAKIFGSPGPRGVTSPLLQSANIFWTKFSKISIWLETACQVDQKKRDDLMLKIYPSEDVTC